jgi:hypothetical protein
LLSFQLCRGRNICQLCPGIYLDGDQCRALEEYRAATEWPLIALPAQEDQGINGTRPVLFSNTESTIPLTLY